MSDKKLVFSIVDLRSRFDVFSEGDCFRVLDVRGQEWLPVSFKSLGDAAGCVGQILEIYGKDLAESVL